MILLVKKLKKSYGQTTPHKIFQNIITEQIFHLLHQLS